MGLFDSSVCVHAEPGLGHLGEWRDRLMGPDHTVVA